MKIQIQFRKHERKCYQSKQMWEKKLHRKVFERIKKSKWEICCRSMGIKHSWNVSKLAGTLCLVETIYNRKIKTHKVVGTGCVWKGSVCLSVCLSVYRSIYLCIYLSIYLSIALSIYLSIYLSIIYIYSIHIISN